MPLARLTEARYLPSELIWFHRDKGFTKEFLSVFHLILMAAKEWDWRYAHLTGEETKAAVLKWQRQNLNAGGWTCRRSHPLCVLQGFLKSLSALRLGSKSFQVP